MSVNIRPITDEELPGYIATTMREYAEDKHTNGGLPLDEARRQSEQETAHYFPDGRLTPGHEVFIATDDAGERVGRLWMAPRGNPADESFIYDIQVEPTARGNGYGRALMQEAAKWSREKGYRTLSLHVFGGNSVAINLYESLGFTTTDRMMKLEL
nr:GNAT family N-acetyltransferase [Flexivirga oryzae]